MTGDQLPPFSSPDQTPPLSDEQRQWYEGLGFEPVEYTLSPLHETFHPENDERQDFNKEIGRFKVVTDTEGKNWLLKSAYPGPDDYFDDDVADRDREIARCADVALREQAAYRLANYIGYPVPETKTVMHDGKPWLAYSFVEDHVDISLRNAQSYGVSNPSAVASRHIFNALVGSYYDEASQGIIDPHTGTYFAQDIVMSTYARGDERTPRVFKMAIVRSFFEESLYFDEVPSLNDEDKRFAHAMLDRALYMNEQEAADLFAHNNWGPDEAVATIHGRAQALSELIDDGAFDPRS